MSDQIAGTAPVLDALFLSKPKDRVLRAFTRRHANRFDLASLPHLQAAVLAHTVSTHDGRLVFIKNSKAGCTTVANLIHLHETGSQSEGSVHEERHKLVQGIRSWRRNLKVLQSPDAVSFSIVREPRSRTVSAFTDFFVEQRNVEAPPHIEAIGAFGFHKRADIGYKFDVFLDYVEASMALSPIRTDRHWRQQVLNLGRPYFELTHVGKLENLGQELLKVSELSGVSLPLPESLSRDKNNRSGDIRFQPSADQIRRIETLYAPDFEAFGY